LQHFTFAFAALNRPQALVGDETREAKSMRITQPSSHLTRSNAPRLPAVAHCDNFAVGGSSHNLNGAADVCIYKPRPDNDRYLPWLTVHAVGSNRPADTQG
jgi:hypothetical protein